MNEKELKEKILKIIENSKSNYITTRSILQKLNLLPKEKKIAKKKIRELVKEGTLLRFKKNLFGIAKNFNLIQGKLDITKEGYGFLIPDEKYNLKEDIFIPRNNVGNAFHNDRVMVEVYPSKKRGRKKLEGKVVQILERFDENLLCEIKKIGKKILGKPIDERFRYLITIKGSIPKDLKIGHIVEVKILTPPEKHTRPNGKIVEVLGEKKLRDVEYKIILKRHKIPDFFPQEVLKEAERIAISPSEEELKKRKDFSGNKIVTIDGEDAKDFDDAVEVKKLKNGNYYLGVHIADVSHYVKPDSMLDKEAFKRGTSVYLPDRAIPMLPQILSNDICSLRPNKIRLTFSVIMEINPEGKIVKRKFYKSFIKSYKRMTYSEVQKILEGDKKLQKKYEDLVPQFFLMAELCEILYKARRKRGAIDFDLPEEKFEFKGKNVIGVYKASRFLSHRIIEEFMIAANISVAEFLTERGYPLLYRVHEPPDPAKVSDFLQFIQFFGYDFKLNLEKLTPKEFQIISDILGESQMGDFLLYQMLRSFKLAIYSEKNVGHFGLSLKNYTHFTSPIRRYADLINHRILKRAIKRRKKINLPLKEIAKHISEREKKATEAERDAIKFEKCKFMEEKIGEIFTGFISFVRENGFYVELIDYFIEGFVPVHTLKGYYIFNEKKQQLISEKDNTTFTISDKVLIKVLGVDLSTYRIDFLLIKKL